MIARLQLLGAIIFIATLAVGILLAWHSVLLGL